MTDREPTAREVADAMEKIRRPIYVFRDDEVGEFGIEILVEIWPNEDDEKARVSVATRDSVYRVWGPPLELVEYQTAEIISREDA